YAEPTVRKQLSPDFLKFLKGKTCFYIKSSDKWVLKEIKKSLDIALKYYKKQGWV
ncbi:MAG: DUF1801 domain-containing protein, partial [Bacteroidetes bacterium]|nr:DUF1801 domain-containing protein [Bacteroidota bacterium]